MRGRIAREYIESELDLIYDISFTHQEVADKIGCAPITVGRLRRSLGVKAPKGQRKGRECIARQKKETRECIKEDCITTFVVKPSATKQYCSHSCHTSVTKNWEYRKPREFSYDIEEYAGYKKAVYKHSNRTYKENIDVINPDGHERTRNGVKGGWQLDHIKPVVECFETGMSIEEASSVDNLRMLPWRENIKRNRSK